MSSVIVITGPQTSLQDDLLAGSNQTRALLANTIEGGVELFDRLDP
jgi:hypothetical protein